MNFLGSFTPMQLMASIVSGVQQSGNAIWPLFVFVGILITFYIAERVGDFVRNSVGRAPKERSYQVGTEDEYPKAERAAIVEAVEIYTKAHPE